MSSVPRKKYEEYEAALHNLIHPEKLESKDKKYIASIEKSLAIFDSSVEWADFISFLTRLNKVLQTHTRSHWIPHSLRISKCLANCISSSLPSGVHRKALEVYETIFKLLGQPLLAKQINLWIPGLLPLMTYAAIGVKPSLIDLLNKYVLGLPPNYLKVITKVLIMSLLPGIDDETSESFDSTMKLLEKLQTNLNDNTHFWQCLFMVIITNPDRRLGALIWCNKNLPNFSPADDVLSSEAEEIIRQDTGLLIRSFIKSLNDDQILVQRGFFDLMISKLKLNSPILTNEKLTSKDDTEKLIMSACLTVLRKDMSLNRRLWNWLLGTDDTLSTPMLDHSETPAVTGVNGLVNDVSSKDRIFMRIKYFSDYAQQYLVNGFLELINSPCIDDRIEGYKVSLAFMDKWEVGLIITSKVFVPFLKSVQTSLLEINEETNFTDSEKTEKDLKYDELFKSASAFFDTIESISIWSTCFQLLDEADDIKTLNNNLRLLLFIIKSFNVNEEDMIINHLPLMLITLLSIKLKNNGSQLDNVVLFEIMKEILEIIPSEVFQPSQNFDGKLPILDSKSVATIEDIFDNQQDVKSSDNKMDYFCTNIYQKIKSYYSKTSSEKTDFGDESLLATTIDSADNDNHITSQEKTLSILVLSTYVMCQSLSKTEENSMFYIYSLFYSDMLDKIPFMENKIINWKHNRFNSMIVEKAHELIDRENLKTDNHMNDFSRDLILDFYSIGMTNNDDLIKDLNIPQNGNQSATIDENYVSIAFGISRLFCQLGASNTDPKDKINLLEVTLELLFHILLLPSNKYEVEVTTFLLNLEITTPAEYIESSISSILIKLVKKSQFDKIMKVVKILWTQTNTNPTDIIMRKPVFLVLNELKYENSNKLMISDWIQTILETNRHDRLFNITITPLLNFKFLYIKEFDLIDDFEMFNYHLQTIINIFKTDESKVLKALKTDITQIDQSLLSILQKTSENSDDAHNNDISTYKNLIIHILIEFLFLKLKSNKYNQGIGYEILESEDFNNAMISSITLLSMLLDATESNADEIMSKLIQLSYGTLKITFENNRINELTNKSITAECLISISYFNLISLYVDKCHHKNRKLTMLTINNDSPIRPEGKILSQEVNDLQLNYIEYLIFTLGYIEDTLVFKFWVKLLVGNLINLSDCIFQVLIPISETICSKIKSFFNLIKFNFQELDKLSNVDLKDTENADQIIGFLMNALEELLSYSHMYLSASEAKPRNANGGIINHDPGFLTSVMSGVFSVESPDAVNFEESNRYTVLLAFETTIKICYDIWLWGEEKSNLIKYADNDQLSSITSPITASSNLDLENTFNETNLNFSKSREYNASKIKSKSRKLMEKLHKSEPVQVLHTLIIGDPTYSNSLFKVLHILDNSRPQLTIPHIFDSIHSKLNPDAVKSRQYKSSLSNKLVDKKLGIFLLEYLKSLDIGVLEDIYSESLGFIKDVNSSPISYRPIMPSILQFVSALTNKLSKVKFGEQRKVRKELGDNYFRVLSYTLTSRGLLSKPAISASALLNHTNESNGSINEEDNLPTSTEEKPMDLKQGPSSIDGGINESAVTKEDICEALIKTVPEINCSILLEGEKSMTVISTIILNAIQPILKNISVSELPKHAVELILVISESPCCAGNKIWRNLIYEIFTDNNFFNIDIKNPYFKDCWAKIIRSWIQDDKDKIIELIAKVQPYGGNSSTLFNWNEGETNSKVLKLKRITYLLMISKKDEHLTQLKELLDKFLEILGSSKNELHYQVFLCLRALMVRVSETYLNQHWIFIYSELEKTFQDFVIEVMNFEDEKSEKQLTEVVDVQSLLSACKLLDLILTIGFEEFSMDEWIFIDSSLETVSGGVNIINKSNDKKLVRSDPLIIGLIDKISKLKKYKLPNADDERRVIMISDSINIENSDKNNNIKNNRLKKPLLMGYSKLENIELLKPFFDSLSYYTFERIYGLKSPDLSACEEDIYNDLFF